MEHSVKSVEFHVSFVERNTLYWLKTIESVLDSLKKGQCSKERECVKGEGVHSASITTNVPYLVNYLIPPFSHFTIDVGEKREKETGQKKMLLFIFLLVLVYSGTKT